MTPVICCLISCNVKLTFAYELKTKLLEKKSLSESCFCASFLMDFQRSLLAHQWRCKAGFTMAARALGFILILHISLLTYV